MSWLFSSKPKLTPKEQVREWSSGLKKEQRQLQREMARMEREEQKTVIEIKKLAKAGKSTALKTLAKGLVQSQHARSRLLEGSVRINSVLLSLKSHAATMNVAEVMGKSSEVMRGMSQLLSIPELHETVKNLSKEMCKAGMIEEMVEEGLSNAFDNDTIEAEAEQEVNKVIDEIMDGTFGQIGKIKGTNTQKKEEEQEAQEEEEKKNMEAMAARLDSLHS